MKCLKETGIGVVLAVAAAFVAHLRGAFEFKRSAAELAGSS